MRKLFAVLVSMLVIACASVCFAAETYQTVYEAINFSEKLGDDEAVNEKFNTPYGTIKIQMRKLWNASSDKRMHVLTWLDDKRISDNYYPEVSTGGYSFRVIKNTSNSELYFVIESQERAYMYGYSPDKNAMMTYIDSLNYAHELGAQPTIVTLKDGKLVLAFEQVYRPYPSSARYQFFWDNSTKWFGYRDLGKDWAPIYKDKQE
ncbi:hypothetical protein [Anaerovibrio sp. RM50]|uniref:hypothetical protein n=1 Tax=Anaerovibrio sp. RM50 TaxID=1200557 RepID=UPI0004871628|nr:hypothetical protein [Anaerovibrio sp. RM50]